MRVPKFVGLDVHGRGPALRLGVLRHIVFGNRTGYSVHRTLRPQIIATVIACSLLLIMLGPQRSGDARSTN